MPLSNRFKRRKSGWMCIYSINNHPLTLGLFDTWDECILKYNALEEGARQGIAEVEFKMLREPFTVDYEE